MNIKRCIFEGVLIFGTAFTLWAGDIAEFNDVSIIDNENAYAVGNNGAVMKKTQDKWKEINLAVTPQIKQTEWDFRGICFVDSQTGWIVGNNDEQQGIVLKTEDGGENWTAGFPKVKGKKLPFYCINFSNASIGYIGAGNGYVLKTVYGGKKWIPTAKPVPIRMYKSKCKVISLWVERDSPLGDHVWAEVVTEEGKRMVSRSIDRGCSWDIWDPLYDKEFRELFGMTRNNPDWVKPSRVDNNE